MRCPARMPPPASQMVNPAALCWRPRSPCIIGVRPNSLPQITRCRVEQAALFEIGQQAGDWLIGPTEHGTDDYRPAVS